MAKEPKKTGTRTKLAKDSNTIALEKDLSTMLGMHVEIKGQAKGGTLSVRYTTLEQLDDVLLRLSHTPVKSD